MIRQSVNLRMRYSAAYLLALLGGNSSPDVAAIAKILTSVGIECDRDRAQKVIDACAGRNVEEIIAGGMIKLSDVLTNTSSETTAQTPSIQPPVENQTAPVEGTEPQPPDSPIDDDTFVSACAHLIDLFLMTMFFMIYFRLVCSIDVRSFNRGKSYSKEEAMSSTIILAIFVLFCIKSALILSNINSDSYTLMTIMFFHNF